MTRKIAILAIDIFEKCHCSEFVAKRRHGEACDRKARQQGYAIISCIIAEYCVSS